MKIRFWEGPSHFHKLLMKGWIIAGILGILFGIFYKDKGVIILSLSVIVVGSVIYGIGTKAWRQWEEQRKNKTL